MGGGEGIAGGGGSPRCMSILRNSNIALSNLRKPHVALSIFRKHHVMSLRPKEGCVNMSIVGLHTPIYITGNGGQFESLLRFRYWVIMTRTRSHRITSPRS